MLSCNNDDRSRAAPREGDDEMLFEGWGGQIVFVLFPADFVGVEK
jgi:hypothetical protein